MGMYMGTNIRLVSDVIAIYDLASKSGILSMLDFTKAFDTLQWDFMFKSVKYFNFGPSYIMCIKLSITTQRHVLIMVIYMTVLNSQGESDRVVLYLFLFLYFVSTFWQLKQEIILHYKAFASDMTKKDNNHTVCR